jgi:hypothetical protein
MEQPVAAKARAAPASNLLVRNRSKYAMAYALQNKPRSLEINESINPNAGGARGQMRGGNNHELLSASVPPVMTRVELVISI